MKEQIRKLLDAQWESRTIKMNWEGLEKILVDILKWHDFTNDEKVQLTKEAIDAFTKRGHFV